MLNTKLERYIETEIIPRYKTFDKAHRIDHARTVITRSLALAARYHLNEEMVYTIAAYHDTGLAIERERHHLISGEILIADTHLPNWFSAEQRNTMRDAVEDHRASSGHRPRTLYGCVVAEADRLIIPETILLRTIQYGRAHYPALDREDHYLRLKEHLNQKYAERGYLKLWIPESDNAEQLEALRRIIRNESQLRALFEQLYEQEASSSEA